MGAEDGGALLGLHTKTAALITMTKKTPTETATSSSFFFSITFIDLPE
jgi:hypothetical protein